MRLFIIALLFAISYAQTADECTSCDCELTGPGLIGYDIAVVTYSGETDLEKDISCCRQCYERSDCEYWVRDIRISTCWLKSNNGATIISAWHLLRRGGIIYRNPSLSPTISSPIITEPSHVPSQAPTFSILSPSPEYLLPTCNVNCETSCEGMNCDDLPECQPGTGDCVGARLSNEGYPELFLYHDGSWGWHPICGHYFWDNEHGANAFCKKLGYNQGVMTAEISIPVIGAASSNVVYDRDSVVVGRCDEDDDIFSCQAFCNLYTIGGGCTIYSAIPWCHAGQNSGITLECRHNPSIFPTTTLRPEIQTGQPTESPSCNPTMIPSLNPVTSSSTEIQYDSKKCAQIAGTSNIYWTLLDLGTLIRYDIQGCTAIEQTRLSYIGPIIHLETQSATDFDCIFMRDSYDFVVSSDKLSLNGNARTLNTTMNLIRSSSKSCFVGHWIYESTGTIYEAYISTYILGESHLPSSSPHHSRVPTLSPTRITHNVEVTLAFAVLDSIWFGVVKTSILFVLSDHVRLPPSAIDLEFYKNGFPDSRRQLSETKNPEVFVDFTAKDKEEQMSIYKTMNQTSTHDLQTSLSARYQQDNIEGPELLSIIVLTEITASETTTTENAETVACSAILLLTLGSLLIYFSLFWYASWKHRQPSDSLATSPSTRSTHNPSVGGRHEHVTLRARTSSDRSVIVQETFFGELFGGEMFSPHVLVMNLSGDIKKGHGVSRYLCSLSFGRKVKLTLNLFDFATDFLFANDMYGTYPCIGLVSGASIMLSTAAFACSLLVDFKAFQRTICAEDRNIIRLRWEILVLTPLEDLVHCVLGLYLFVYDLVNFIAYLCIMFSVGTVMARLFHIVLATHGGLREVKRRSSVKVGEESLFEGEGTVEMMELDCEEGGEIFVETKSTENVTTKKRDPADQVEDLSSPKIKPES